LLRVERRKRAETGKLRVSEPDWRLLRVESKKRHG
jgi:hypothetical protein